MPKNIDIQLCIRNTARPTRIVRYSGTQTLHYKVFTDGQVGRLWENTLYALFLKYNLNASTLCTENIVHMLCKENLDISFLQLALLSRSPRNIGEVFLHQKSLGHTVYLRG